MALNEHQIELFKTLTELNGISGQENEVAKYLKDYYEKLGFEIITDNLGSIFACKKSKLKNAPKVMMAAHMDEVGFIVVGIEKNGMLKGHAVGGINEETLLSSRVLLKNKQGSYLLGSIGAIPPHLLSNDNKGKTQVKDMLFDFGFLSDKEAIDAGVYIGAMMVIQGSFNLLNNGKRILAKAIDNRYGLVIGIEILEHFKDVDLPYDLFVGGTVQEEVGCRGAQTISNVIKPDLAIVVDCSPSRDSSGDKSQHGQLGGGILIRYVDSSMIAFKNLLDFQIKMAERANVPYQYFDSPGGTDAGTIHKSDNGVLTLTHCVCARSIHTCSSVLDVNDYLSAFASLKVMLENINSEIIKSLKEKK